MGINVKSEIAPLKKVLLHRPGAELENLTPEYLERLLFDDIPYLENAQKEHDAFAEILRNNGVEVVYLHKLAAEVMADPAIRTKFITQWVEEAGIKNKDMKKKVFDFINAIKDNEAMIQKTMAGLNKNELPKTEAKTLADHCEDDYPFAVDPMPNLYFTRDPFASIGTGVSLNKMFSVTRSRETIYAEYIFDHHKDYAGTRKHTNRYDEFSIEGGDILTLNAKTLAVGISQRTAAEAIEKLAHTLFFDTPDNEIEVVLALDIPKTRAYMHLDTVFTQIDHDKFTIHPQIKGPLSVFELTKGDGKVNVKKETLSLEQILAKHLGGNIKLIECGGGDYVISQREQWNDGSNTLCIKPGEVVVYDRNYVTNRILEEAGIKLHVMPSGEVSRGRGGPRCMSMPLVRE